MSTEQPQDRELPRYRFGVFELDAHAGELRKQGRLVRLQGQPLQILLALLERPGIVVTREELRQRLWQDDTFVEFDHSLNTAIKRLRETLGDTASTPRFVETLPRRGYRFITPVSRLDAPAGEPGEPLAPPLAAARADSTPAHAPQIAPDATMTARADRDALAGARHVPGDTSISRGETSPPSSLAGAPAQAESREARPHHSPWSHVATRRTLVATAALAALIAVALLFMPGVFRRAPQAVEAANAIPRIAVLSFENLTGDPARAHVADGFTEELVSQLGRLAPGRLGVIARSSSSSFKTPDTPLGEIAHALNVDFLIEGSVRNDGDRYRIAVRLVRTHDLTAVWSELYEGALLDLVSMQRDVGQQVARHLTLTLLPSDQAAMARAMTSDSRAYEAYLRGLSELARGPGEGFTRAVELFEQAIAIDPRYALAHAGLAESYIMRRDYYLISPEEALPAARAAAEHALALDDTLAEAHCALADVLSRVPDETAAADREFTRALALNPSRAETQLRYAAHLARSGRAREGRERVDRARILAPRSADVITEAAWMEVEAGRLDAAASLASEALRYQPDFPFARYVLGHIALRRAAPREAIAQFERARVTSGQAPKYIAALATAYIAASRPADAARMLDDLRTMSRDRYVPPGTIEHITEQLK